MSQPLERENLRIPFVSLSVLIAGSTAWCFWQEFVTRRPWIAYQESFNKHYLVPKAQHDLDVAKGDLKAHDAELKKLQAQLEEAQAAVRDPAKRAPFEKAQAELDRLNIKVEEAEQDVKFAKSDLDAAYYVYKHAAHQAPAGGSKELAEALKGMRAVEARIDKLNKSLTAVTLEREKARTAFEQFAGTIKDLTQKIEDIREPVSDAELKLDKAKDKGTEMTQVWIPDLANANPPGVDRCQNCHVAVDMCGFTDPHEIVAERKRLAAGGELSEADQLALSKKYCTDEAQMKTWETELDKDPKRGSFTGYALPLVFRTHPFRNDLLGGNHPVGNFGCTICHGGEGPQTKGLGWHKFEHALDDHYWAGWNEPLLDLAEVQGKQVPGHPFVESMCAQCHRQDTDLPHAPILSQGRQFMSEIGCYGCHPIDGYNQMRHPGPTLTDVQAKLQPGWIEKWISNPRGWRPHTRMPNFWPEALDESGKLKEGSAQAKLRQEEVSAIAAYLWSTSTKKTGDLPLPAALATADAERGHRLVQTVGCYACHKIEKDDPRRPISSSEARDFAPDLSNIGAKTNVRWLYWWVKNPTSMWSETKMPNLRLSDQEAADIATFLSSHTGGEDYRAAPPELGKEYDPKAFADLTVKGKALIDKYGCFGCHVISGFENAQKIGADLSQFGKKPIELLDFGDAITDHHEQTWYNWLNLKLRHPRAYRYERVDTRMPQFDLDDEEVKLLMVFLKGEKGPAAVPHQYLADQSPDRQAIVAGQRLLEYYNCRGCHVIDGNGGVIRDRYKDDTGKPDDYSMAPPKFNHEGAKIQPSWGFGFIKHPIPLRPWLQVRMPTFPLGDDTATDIIHYFAASAGKSWPYLYAETPMPEASEIETAKTMLTGPTDGAPGKRGFGCLSCHSLGAPPPGTDLATAAPNFYLAEQRLRPDWIVSWITNPMAIIDDTKMPSFFTGEQSLFPEYLGGDSKKQIEALRDLLMHLREALPPPSEAKPKSAAAAKPPAKHAKRG